MNIRTQLANKLSADICFSEERILTEALCSILGQNYPIQALKGRLDMRKQYGVYPKTTTTYFLDNVAFLETFQVEYEMNDDTNILTAKFNYRVLL